MRTCIFCDNPAGNREHLWAKWIHQRHDFGPLKMDRYDQEQVIIPDPEFKVKSVCHSCNNGWMSDLENISIPIIGSMFNDLSITLDGDMQRKVAEWTIKTAMVLDSTRPRAAGARFYPKPDCVAIKERLILPEHTRVWIGRSDEKHILAQGTDYQYLDADTQAVKGKSTITTIVTGHFVAQSITQRKMPRFADLEMPVLQPKEAEWNDFLLPIWPSERIVIWPPKRTFTNGGSNGIGYLMDRWRVGERIHMIRHEENGNL